MAEFEPKIAAFLCNWCAYAGADLAGVSRLQYPADLRTVRVMCSGRVDPLFITRAFKQGCDGVLVAGCLEGDCHFKTGNVKALQRVNYIKGYLEEIGIEAERVQMENMSAGMGGRFARITTEFTEKIRELGPNPVKAGISRLAAS